MAFDDGKKDEEYYAELINHSLRAIILTREYVGEKLPFEEGWEWYDYCERVSKLYPNLEWVRQYRMRKNCASCYCQGTSRDDPENFCGTGDCPNEAI